MNHPLWLLAPILLPALLSLLLYCLPVKSRRLRNLFTETAVILCSILLWCLLLFFGKETLSWEPIPGTVFCLSFDGLGRFFAGLVATLWPFATLYALEYMEKDPDDRLFFLFFLLSFGMTAGVCLAGNLLTMYVFYEFLTLSTIPLVMHGFSADHRHAARKYAIYSIGGAAFALAGILWLLSRGSAATFVYGGNLTDAVLYDPMSQVMFLLLLLGLGVKAAIFPFHGWLPTASVAPTPVTALLHAVAVVKAGIFAVIRLCYYVYGPRALYGEWSQYAALGLVGFTVIYGAAMAVKERHFKRRLAYSTVSNLSYILCGVLLCTPAGLSAGLLHMVFHAIMKMVAFFVAGAVRHHGGIEYLYELNGIGKKLPLPFACFTICVLSLMGVPGFCGFISKYRLLVASLKSGYPGWISLASLIIGALLCAVYMLTIVTRAFFPAEGKDRFPTDLTVEKPGWKMLLPILLFAALTILFGLFPAPVIAITDAVAGV